MTRHKKYLGEFEILTLAAITRLTDQSYGVKIRQEIEIRTGRSVSVGALYTTLSRLEKKAYISSRIGEATPERGGRAKRYFKITPSGQAQLDRSILAIRNMLDGVGRWTELPVK